VTFYHVDHECVKDEPMKPQIRAALIISLTTLFCLVPRATAQTGSMTDTAVRLWKQNNRVFPDSGDFHFDRVTREGELVVFETFHPATFIIMSETAAGEVLVGYSFENLFFGTGEEPSVQPLLLESLDAAVRKHFWRIKGTRSLTEGIGPLINTRWGQGKFFNYYCPRDARGPNGRTYNGCVAVAMGQIIRYYGGFNSINTQYSYNSGRFGTLSAKVGPYDWPVMEDSPITVSLEVSDFLSDLGIMLQMSYGASGSTTNGHRALEVFHELGYINGVVLRKSKFSMESWMEVFYETFLNTSLSW
jgi:hypothetical protein